jgi:predicted nucleotidyltransferase
MTKKHKERLKALGVLTAYLFGSRANRTRTQASDTDIGVVFRSLDPGNDDRAIYHALYQLFSELYPDSPLDIVLLQRSPLSLQYSAVKDGKILYESDPVSTADYEYRLINQYLDFRPLLDIFDRAAADRYGEEKRSSQ